MVRLLSDVHIKDTNKSITSGKILFVGESKALRVELDVVKCRIIHYVGHASEEDKFILFFL